MNLEQLATLNSYEIPAHIEAIDALLTKGMTEAQTADLEYQFRVVYTLDSVTKSRANFQFVRPDSAEGKDIHNVLVKHLPADHLYPHKPGKVVELVCEKSRKAFTSHNHTQAWRKFKARPLKGASQPDNTNRDFCIYLATHKDYTYSDQWVKHLIAEVSDDQKFADLKAFALK